MFLNIAFLGRALFKTILVITSVLWKYSSWGPSVSDFSYSKNYSLLKKEINNKEKDEKLLLLSREH